MRNYSPKRAKQMRQYSKEVKEWIVGKKCAVCGREATQCHHKKGRTGDLLLNKNFWLPVCHRCYERITEDSRWAIENGFSLLRSTK